MLAARRGGHRDSALPLVAGSLRSRRYSPITIFTGHAAGMRRGRCRSNGGRQQGGAVS